MPRPTDNYRYPWPASAITAADMALLHNARETSTHKTPITALVAEAVRQCYRHAPAAACQTQPPQERKEA